jgi:tellurite resistance protein TehA-like permease
MNKRFPPMIILALIIFICIANGIADYWHLYFYIWWLDIPMHILGGFWVALTSLAIYYAFRGRNENDHSTVFVYALAIASALLVGLVWEVFEFSVDSIVSEFVTKPADIIKDLIDDLIGGVLAAVLFASKGYNKKI